MRLNDEPSSSMADTVAAEADRKRAFPVRLPDDRSPRDGDDASGRYHDAKRRAYSSFSLPRTFSTSSTAPFLLNSLQELKDVFDMESSAVVEDEESAAPQSPSLTKSKFPISRRRSSTVADTDLKTRGSGGSTPLIASQAGAPLNARGVRNAFYLASILWTALLVWASVQQDSDLVSPLLMVPAFLPLPLSITASLLLTRKLTKASREALSTISKALRAHVLLQGLVALAVIRALGETAYYHHKHQTAQRDAERGNVGSLSNQATFLLVSIAQAALPAALALGTQWSLAASLSHVVAIRPDASADGLSGRCSPHSSILPCVEPLRESPEPIASLSAEDLFLSAGKSMDRTPKSDNGLSRKHSRGQRRTHRSSRPSISGLGDDDEKSAAGKHYAHRRTFSQPVMGFMSPTVDRTGLSDEAAFLAQPLLTKAVRDSIAAARRTRTCEEMSFSR